MIYNQFIHYIVDHLLSKRVLFIFSVIGQKLRRQKEQDELLRKICTTKTLSNPSMQKGQQSKRTFSQKQHFAIN